MSTRSTHSALVELTPLECDIDLPEKYCGRATFPMLNQSCSIWTGGWRMTTTTYDGPEYSNKR